MPFILFILLFISAILAVFAFAYPLAILSVILQSLFFLLAFYVLIRRIKKKKGFFGTTLITTAHGAFLALILVTFFSYAVKMHETGDMDDILTGLRKMISKAIGTDPVDLTKPQHPGEDEGYTVEDPPEFNTL